MDPDRWREIKRWYQGVLERPEAERAAFLDQAWAGDATLGDEMKSRWAQGGHGANFNELLARPERVLWIHEDN